MKNADQIRELLEKAHGKTHEAELYSLIGKTLALLPCKTCKTCNGTSKSLEYAKACPECGCPVYINENLIGEGYRLCRHCQQDWWLNVKYNIGLPCPDCQPTTTE